MSRISTGIANENPSLRDLVVVIPAGTTQLDPAQHANRLLYITEPSQSIVVNLPYAMGTGDVYEFLNGIIHASGSITINARHPSAGTSNKFVGQIVNYTSALTAVTYASTANDVITINGTTTGGAKSGDRIVLIDVAEKTWAVKGTVFSSGANATPFSG